jgi:hypothetical protein
LSEDLARDAPVFFKHRKPPPPPQAAPPEKGFGPSTLADRAEAVAIALRSFEELAYANGNAQPPDDLVKARELVDAATLIVSEGRLAYALLRQLLPETRTWPAWIMRPDFYDLVHFDGRDVVATKNRENGTTTKEISFSFRGRVYKLLHMDRGYSAAPDADYKWGEVSFHAGDVLVLSVSATEGLDDDYWEMSSVKALRVGDTWMMDLLQIAMDIETGQIRQREKFRDNLTLEAARNIKLEYGDGRSRSPWSSR